MRLAIFGFILMLFTKIIEDFRIWAARVADWRGFNAATAGPPVFFIVIEEDTLIALNAAFVAILGGVDFSDFGIDASFFENLLPNASSLVVAWDAVFFVTNKASDIDFSRIETDFFGQESEEIANLLLFEIIAK